MFFQEEVNANYTTLCPIQFWVQVIIQMQWTSWIWWLSFADVLHISTSSPRLSSGLQFGITNCLLDVPETSQIHYVPNRNPHLSPQPFLLCNFQNKWNWKKLNKKTRKLDGVNLGFSHRAPSVQFHDPLDAPASGDEKVFSPTAHTKVSLS